MSKWKNQNNPDNLPVVFEGEKGPKSPPQPTRTPDTLRSEDAVEAILGVSEGPIEGLDNGLQSVYVGDTPVQNADGSKNFEVMNVTLRRGLPEVEAEPLKPYLGGQSSNIQVNTTLAYQVEVVRQLTLKNVDSIDLRFAVQQLFRQDDSGVYEHELRVAVYLKRSDEATWRSHFVPADATEGNDFLPLKGKTTSTYVKELRIPVYEKGDFFWQVRVIKWSEDTNPDQATDVVWESIQMVFHEEKKYPNTAILQLYARASNQFSSIPEFSAIIKGIQCKVPTNYDSILKTYTGVWDGTFKLAWTDNPAWILYDFITNDRYGMSAVTPVNIDKYDAYEAAQFCDELVPDGAGGQQPRYTFNARIQTARGAMEQARYIAGAMGGVLYDNHNGTVFLKMDRNEDASHIFSYENIGEQGFTYEFTDVTTRYNDITVSFVNPLTNWEEDRRRIFDQDSIDEFGRVPFDFVAVGCTSESEALRRAYYKMNTALTETMMVTFETNRLGLSVKPFDVILISDSDLGYGLSGRIKTLDGARTTITLRDPLYLEAGINYVGRFRTPDGVVERTVNSGTTGEVYEFSVTSALPTNTPEHCTFILEENPGEGLGAPKPFRVARIAEADGDPDKVTITAHELNRNKFTDSENLVTSEGTDYSGSGDPANIPGPTNVVFRDFYQKTENAVWTVVTPTLDRTAYRFYSGSFEVYSRPVEDGSPVGTFVQREVFYGDTLVNHPPGPHEFIIVPRNTYGQTPPLALLPVWTFTVSSRDTIGVKPEPVANVQIYPKPAGFVIDWDIEAGEVDYVHHFVVKEGPTEETAVVIGDNIKETFFLVDPMTKRSYNLYIYAVSNSYVYSDAVNISYENTAPAPPSNLTVEVAFETVMAFFDRNTEIDIVGYRLQIRKLGTSEWLDMDPSGRIEDTESDTAYEVRVAAQDALTLILADEVWSVPLSFRTRDTQGVEKGFDEVQQVTAVNLLRNGSFERGEVYWNNPEGAFEVLAAADAPHADSLNGTSKVLKLGDGSAVTSRAASDQVVVRPLLPYTLSFEAKLDAANPGENHKALVRVYDENGDSNTLTQFDQFTGNLLLDAEDDLSSTEYRRFFTTVTMPEGAVRAEVEFQSQASGVLFIDSVQFQKGRVATPFNPHVSEELSPEDLKTITNPDSTPPGVVTALSAEGSFRNITLTWTAPADTDISRYDVRYNTSNDYNSAQLAGSATSPVFSWQAPVTNQTYYFWVEAVDTSGNRGAYSAVVSAQTIPLSAADFQDLSIVNAMIADAAIDDAKIANLSASKITAGTITAGSIFLSNDRFRLEGQNQKLRVLDDTGLDRVVLGKLGSGAQDYGIQVKDASGKLILGATGLGLDVVGSGQLAVGAVGSSNIAAEAILAEKLAVGSVTASKIASSSITSAKIAAGAITADKLSVTDLAAITADLGEITAGTLSGAGGAGAMNFWNLNTGEFKVGAADESEYIWYDPVQNKVLIRGQVQFEASGVTWQDVVNKPDSLSDISAEEGAKLATVAQGADVTSENTAANVAQVGAYPANDVAYWANDPAVRIEQQSTQINGNKIKTGTLTANKINASSLSSISANIGTVTAGLLRNSNNSARINLAAGGSNEFINCGNQFIVTADGHFTANSGSIRGDLLVAGTVTADRIVTNGISEMYVNTNAIDISATGQEKFLIFLDMFQAAPTVTIPGSNPDSISISLNSNLQLSGGNSLNRFEDSTLDSDGRLRNQSRVITLPPGNHTLFVWRYITAYNQWYNLHHYPGQGLCKLTVLKMKR